VGEPGELENRIPNQAGQQRLRGKGTWLLEHGELAGSKGPSTSLRSHRVSVNALQDGSHTLDINPAGTPMAISPPLGDSTLPDKVKAQAHNDVKALERQHTIPKESSFVYEHYRTDIIPSSQYPNVPQRDVNVHDGTKHQKPSQREKQDEIEEGKKLFETRKREQKKEIAQEVLKVNFYYRFVGECYVHGMMNGEAIKLQNERIIPTQVFELR